jgi:hypothetical protein
MMLETPIKQERWNYLCAMLFVICAVTILITIITPTVLAAKTISGDQILIEEELNENLYAIGNTIETRNYINGDLVAIAADDKINGIVSGDVTLIGINVLFNKSTTRTAKILAGSAVVNGYIDGDLIIVAADATVTENVEVKGDLIIIANSATVNGKINGNTNIKASHTVLNALMLGNATVSSQQIKIGNVSSIKGDLNYSSKDRIYNIQKVVKGTTVFQKLGQKTYLETLRSKMYLILSLLIVAIILFSLIPTTMQNLIRTANVEFTRTILYGAIALIAIPILVILFFMTIIGIPMALMLAALYATMLYLSPIVIISLSGIAIRNYLFPGQLVKKKHIKQKLGLQLIQSLIIGLFIYILVICIPLLGGTVELFSIVVGFGAVTMHVIMKIKENRAAAK